MNLSLFFYGALGILFLMFVFKYFYLIVYSYLAVFIHNIRIEIKLFKITKSLKTAIRRRIHIYCPKYR